MGTTLCGGSGRLRDRFELPQHAPRVALDPRPDDRAVAEALDVPSICCLRSKDLAAAPRLRAWLADPECSRAMVGLSLAGPTPDATVRLVAGLAHGERPEPAEAVQRFARWLFEQTGEQPVCAASDHELGSVAVVHAAPRLVRGRNPPARRRRVLARRDVDWLRSRSERNPRARVPYLRALAVLARWRGDEARAQVLLTQPRDVARVLDLPGEPWPIKAELASICVRLGQPGRANEASQRARDVVRALAAQIDDEALRASFLDGALARISPVPA